MRINVIEPEADHGALSEQIIACNAAVGGFDRRRNVQNEPIEPPQNEAVLNSPVILSATRIKGDCT